MKNLTLISKTWQQLWLIFSNSFQLLLHTVIIDDDEAKIFLIYLIK